MLTNILVVGVTELADRRDGSPWRLPPGSPRAIGAEMDPVDDELEDHLRLLAWLAAHPTGSLAAAAQALDLAVTDVEGLCADLANAGLIERAWVAVTAS